MATIVNSARKPVPFDPARHDLARTVAAPLDSAARFRASITAPAVMRIKGDPNRAEWVRGGFQRIKRAAAN